jgi:hypothetical protein
MNQFVPWPPTALSSQPPASARRDASSNLHHKRPQPRHPPGVCSRRAGISQVAPRSSILLRHALNCEMDGIKQHCFGRFIWPRLGENCFDV